MVDIKEEVLKLKGKLSESIYNKLLYISDYLYIEKDNYPSISVVSEDEINIVYSNDNDSFKIKIDADFNIDNLYNIVNSIKLFYQPNTTKMCLFTGAFNPPTIAHYHMIESASKAYPFDYIVFAVSNQSFLDRKQKRNNDWAFSEKDRLNMLTYMTCHLKNVLIFGVEKGYTYDVLCAVKEKYHPADLFFALGSDKLNEIGHWGHHDKLLSEYCFYILNRGENMVSVIEKSEVLFRKTKYIVHNEDNKFSSVSATKVRRNMDDEKDFKDLVHPKVYSFLKKYEKG